MTTQKPRMFSTKEAAAYLGVSTSYLEKARCRNDGSPTYKLGSKIIYAVTELDDWMKGRRGPGGQHV